MKCVKLLAVCMTLVLFCTGVVGCTDILDESPSVTTTQDAGASTTIRNTTTTSTSKPTTTTTATTTTIKKTTTTTKKVTTTTATTTIKKTTTTTRTTAGEMVWVSGTGKKYHNNPSCSGMKNPSQISLSTAQKRGLTPCKNCY